MKTFISEDFLLQNDFGKVLFHDHAKNLPIIDYHNHLSPKEICKNRVFENISQVWLAGDHYKWRAMRALGVNERFITGAASDKEKFSKWSSTVPFTMRNPLYHWAHLELQRYFGISELLSEQNANAIYQETSEKLQNRTHHTVGLLQQQNVETLCTTDDPIDSLEYHERIKSNNGSLNVYPAFRPDKAYGVESPKVYLNYIDALSETVNFTIKNYDDLLTALENRIDFFHSKGSRIADHGLEQLYHFSTKKLDCNILFKKLKDNKQLTKEEISYFKAETLLFLSKCYHKKGWVQQYHLGAIRDNNKRLLSQLGADTGFDSIGDFSQMRALSSFLNELDSSDQLSKTIIYNLNPSDNEAFATMAGNFNDGSIKGKVQYGAAWWFLDQKDGMEKQLNTLSNIGLLSCFVGMLTDSRSFLSFPRHEYFRRVLCNLIGQDVERGELPADEKWLGKIVQDICYYNAKDYFNFPRA
ncbi:glucuronate isomerase [Maribacter sp. HTCC2170]|uniref:glucuronate isomerase n=1 Tax=Maribacter sp. (strain HTCC2170 / KCCM 42371) TaxID=313603 RepID=UPI00006AFD4F|nr:glucuronate isomerase [Maribacter sp. HTCC2170]EAR01172.1 uronate isomerase [Maribacter sp. HTCC2170]